MDNASMNCSLTMHSNGMRLLKLINDLLDLIRLEAGRMEVKREPLEVADFIKGLASAARQVAEDKKIKLETYTDLRLGVVAADPRQTGKNRAQSLVQRAEIHARRRARGIARGKTGRRTRFHCQRHRHRHRRKKPAVCIRPLLAGGRFGPTQISGRGHRSGAGQGIDRNEHGNVVVESQEGKGTTLHRAAAVSKGRSCRPESAQARRTGGNRRGGLGGMAGQFVPPRGTVPGHGSLRGAAKPVELGKRGQRPVVLVADDEPDMRRFLRSQLDADYDVLEAADGLQALEKATPIPAGHHFAGHDDAGDGWSGGVPRNCASTRHTPTFPIILLTARADEETKFNALEVGANDFLAKPFSSTELHARIKNLVESHDFQRNLSTQNRALSNTIEQLKETESQLVQSEKLASLGRMSAGIIHEINNPLNFATTGLFALRNKCKHLAPEQRGEYEEILSDIEEGIKRVRNIVSDLRMFTHPEAGPSRPGGRGRGRGRVAAVSGRRMEGQGADRTESRRRAQTVWANRNKLIHVLVNLLQNSLDAMRQKKFAERNAGHLDRGPRWRATGASSSFATMARALSESIWTRFSTRFSPPRTWAKAWGWA